MDYKLKYLKYKQKYLALKEQYIFAQGDSFKQKYFVLKEQNEQLKTEYDFALKQGGKIDSAGIGIKYTKEDYDKSSKIEQDKFPFYCQDDKPFLCSLESKNYGLCKPKITDCLKYEGENTYLTYDLSDSKKREALEYGKNFGYNLYDNSDKDCSKLIEDSKGSYEGTFIVPKKFKIMTYNCWWSMKVTGDATKDEFHLKFFKIRINDIARIINGSDADIICLQEVGNLTFEILEPLLKNKYPYYYETPVKFNKDDKGPRGRFLEALCFTKFPVKGFKLFSVQGVLSYNNSMLMLEFDNIIVFNVYLQAGTRNSPGQKDLWFNYSRCRYNEYLAIGKYLKDNKIDKPIVVLGDFNTNLNGNLTEWPELKAFSQLNLQDSWLEKFNKSGGFTEDTKINLMRWNVKFEEKIYRIDGIFYSKDKFKTNEIIILGDKPIDIDEDMQKKFIDFRVPSKFNKDELIRKNDKKIQLWPSDHFAVMADLEFI